jgi:mono/diheme cytochrome c family protein
MRRGIAVLIGLAVAAVGTRVAAAEPPDPDLGAEVRGVFAAKCAGCHGSDLPKPKGRFGYVLDLRRVADNPEMVIPGRPDESELLALIRHGEMPPTDSPRGPLTATEKEVIRAWIAAGAPAPSAPVAAGAGAFPGPEPASTSADAPQISRTLRLVGKFHLLLIHFPIALLVAAGVAEVVSAVRRSNVPSLAVRFCLSLAAVAVVPTVVLGWIHAGSGYGAGSPDLLLTHRWLGTATGVCVIGTAVWAESDARRGRRSRGFRTALTAGIALVIAAAHVGGLMVHGGDFLEW